LPDTLGPAMTSKAGPFRVIDIKQLNFFEIVARDAPVGLNLRTRLRYRKWK